MKAALVKVCPRSRINDMGLCLCRKRILLEGVGSCGFGCCWVPRPAAWACKLETQEQSMQAQSGRQKMRCPMGQRLVPIWRVKISSVPVGRCQAGGDALFLKGRSVFLFCPDLQQSGQGPLTIQRANLPYLAFQLKQWSHPQSTIMEIFRIMLDQVSGPLWPFQTDA